MSLRKNRIMGLKSEFFFDSVMGTFSFQLTLTGRAAVTILRRELLAQ